MARKKTKLLQLGTWISVGCRREPQGWLSWGLITPLAFAIGVYVVLAATTIIIDPWPLTAVFLMSIMGLAFLVVGARPDSDANKPSVVDWVLFGLSIVTGAYFFVVAEDVANRISLLFPLTPVELFFGTVAFLLSVEMTRRTTGLGLTTIVLVFVAYNFLGHLLPGVLGHGYIDYNHFLDIMVYTTDGVMGLPVRVAATYAFMFVLFGTFLYAARGADFFYDFAASLAGRQSGGPAKVAVVSSGMYGMISGSPTSDVVTTGSVTIPVMKRVGYSGAVAGGIESAASTGGSIMPPVMGSAAFIMAEYTGIDYADIAIAAILPAILYYVGVYAQVHFHSVRLGFGGIDPNQIPKFFATLKNGGTFFVPLVVLVWALLEGYSPSMVAAYGTLSVIGVALLSKRTRIGVVAAYRAIAEASMRAVPVAGATAAAGLVIAGLTMTGLVTKFAHVVYMITEAQLLYTLLVAAVLTIIFGMGMPTPSAYILAAILIGPLMAQLDVNPLPGHLFLLYFAVLSAVTPPVAVAAYAASSIAGGNPLVIAGQATRFALAAFLVPFVFVYGPELLWMGPLWQTAITFVTAAVGIVFVAAAIEGYEPLCAEPWGRALLAGAGLFMITPFHISTFAGLALAAATIGTNRMWLKSKARPRTQRR